MKKILFILAAVSILIFIFVVSQKTRQPDYSQKKTERINITVSIYPLSFLVQKVGGDHVSVLQLTPQGIEPHEYEPTPTDMAALYHSEGVILNGGGLDIWGEKISEDLKKNNISLLVMMDKLQDQVITIKENGMVYADPHIWLSPKLYMDEVSAVADFLSSLDPKNSDVYVQNAKNYIKELTLLHEDFSKILNNCQQNEIIVSHDAFTYLGSEYNIIIHAISGITPEEEPSPDRLIELARLIREKKINTVFFETLVSPKLAETLAKETGATAAVFNPIEGLTDEDIKNNKNYDILMRENLTALQKSLVCH